MPETLLEVDEARAGRCGQALPRVSQVVEGDVDPGEPSGTNEGLIDRVATCLIAIGIGKEVPAGAELVDMVAKEGEDVRRNRNSALPCFTLRILVELAARLEELDTVEESPWEWWGLRAGGEA